MLRATATFMRTAVTRNTPWDGFLAGANGALTEQQRRGARLFFTSADKRGAGCYSCHSGPMLVSTSTEGGRQTDVYRITNNSTSVVDTHLLLVARGLPARSRMENASGVTSTGDPYLRVFLPEGVLRPGQSIVLTLQIKLPAHPQRAIYSLGLLSGQGTP